MGEWEKKAWYSTLHNADVKDWLSAQKNIDEFELANLRKNAEESRKANEARIKELTGTRPVSAQLIAQGDYWNDMISALDSIKNERTSHAESKEEIQTMAQKKIEDDVAQAMVDSKKNISGKYMNLFELNKDDAQRRIQDSRAILADSQRTAQERSEAEREVFYWESYIAGTETNRMKDIQRQILGNDEEIVKRNITGRGFPWGVVLLGLGGAGLIAYFYFTSGGNIF